MHTEDWVIVGLRLFGAYLMVQALLGLVDWLEFSQEYAGEFNLGLRALRLALSLALGILLFNWGKRPVRGRAERA